MSPRKLPRRLPAFLAVWRGQPETEAAFVDLKGLAAPAVIVHLPAALDGHRPPAYLFFACFLLAGLVPKEIFALVQLANKEKLLRFLFLPFVLLI